MKALSIRQPWAALILAGVKNVENRTWHTNYRGPIAIHAGVAYDREAIAAAEAIIATLDDETRARVAAIGHDIASRDLARGGIVGVVDLVGISITSQSPFAIAGNWHWQLRNPRRTEFLPMRGRLQLFDVEGVVEVSS